jgi:hypothetical protein
MSREGMVSGGRDGDDGEVKLGGTNAVQDRAWVVRHGKPCLLLGEITLHGCVAPLLGGGVRLFGAFFKEV